MRSVSLLRPVSRSTAAIDSVMARVAVGRSQWRCFEVATSLSVSNRRSTGNSIHVQDTNPSESNASRSAYRSSDFGLDGITFFEVFYRYP